MTVLPLDTLRAYLGLPPWQFWGFADPPGPNSIVPMKPDCPTVTYEYDWQGSDAAGRASIRQSIADAERMAADYLGFYPAPTANEAVVPWPRYHDIALHRGINRDATDRRIALQLPHGYVQALGVERLNLIGVADVSDGTLVYSAQFNPILQDTFTITLPLPSGMDLEANHVEVYFSDVDRFDSFDFSRALGSRWRIEPVHITVDELTNTLTITGRKWLVGRPILYENPVATVLRPQDPNNFVTSLEVYQRTIVDGTTLDDAQSVLLYESRDCCQHLPCCEVNHSTDPAAVGRVIARADIRDSTLGLVTPAKAIYHPDRNEWSSAWCCRFCEPDRVLIRYVSGVPLDNPLNGQMRTIVAQLAAAEMKRRVCACRDVNERLHDLQIDLTLESTETERYSVPMSHLENPFGSRRGHVRAWLLARDLILRRGIAV